MGLTWLPRGGTTKLVSTPLTSQTAGLGGVVGSPLQALRASRSPLQALRAWAELLGWDPAGLLRALRKGGGVAGLRAVALRRLLAVSGQLGVGWSKAARRLSAKGSTRRFSADARRKGRKGRPLQTVGLGDLRRVGMVWLGTSGVRLMLRRWWLGLIAELRRGWDLVVVSRKVARRLGLRRFPPADARAGPGEEEEEVRYAPGWNAEKARAFAARQAAREAEERGWGAEDSPAWGVRGWDYD